MHLSRLDHVQLAMPIGSEDRARAFYAGLLGIDEVPKPADLAVRGGCWFEHETLKIHLGADADFHPARKAHPALVVEDLPALLDTLRQAGFPPRGGEPLPGYHRAYVDDPFGNRIELMEPGGGPTPGSDPDEVEALRARVATLEEESGTLRATVARLRSEKASLLQAAARRDYERPPHYQ